MDDQTQRLTLKMPRKTYVAMLGFLKKHDKTVQDVPRFIEDAIIWRILDRQLAFTGAHEKTDVDIFTSENPGCEIEENVDAA